MRYLLFLVSSLFLLPGVVLGQCELTPGERQQKQELRQTDRLQYQSLIKLHGEKLTQCRGQNWPEMQGIWLRLYPGDALPGVMDEVLDRIVDRGYSHVFVEVFYDGRVLLPVSQNTTPWRSVTEEAVKQRKLPANTDLWQMAVKKSKERGLKVYGWMFSLNFGYGYGERPDRSGVLARNGKGETSIANSRLDRQKAAKGNSFYLDLGEPEHLFIDPYHPQAQTDLRQIVKAFSQQSPDGMLFDYVRYPNTFGKTTLIDRVSQLWIYGPASRKALLAKIPDGAPEQEMNTYLDRGGDITNPKLWQQVTNHAYGGVVQFIEAVTKPIPNQIPIGTVFFPGGNRRDGLKLDTRMQPWDKFSTSWQRHPMTYGLCLDGKCVAAEVEQVLQQSDPKTLVCPVLAGVWQKELNGHAPLEVQMQEIKNRTPQIKCLSHFVYGWIEPESDRARKFLIPPPQ